MRALAWHSPRAPRPARAVGLAPFRSSHAGAGEDAAMRDTPPAESVPAGRRRPRGARPGPWGGRGRRRPDAHGSLGAPLGHPRLGTARARRDRHRPGGRRIRRASPPGPARRQRRLHRGSDRRTRRARVPRPGAARRDGVQLGLARRRMGDRRLRAHREHPVRPQADQLSIRRGRGRERRGAVAAAVVEQVERGTVDPGIDTVYELGEIAEAHRRMAAGAATGKLVVVTGRG